MPTIFRGNLETKHSILGANHDHEVSWCPESGYIMEDAPDKKFFFSCCSDVQISDYTKSARGSCLMTIDEHANPVIGQDFGGVSPPTLYEQCKKSIRDPNALGKCRNVLCWASPANGGYGIRIGLAENSACMHSLHGDEGRCFRARCRPVSAQLINVGSNQCLLSSGGRFVGIDNATAIVDSCPQHQTPLNSIARITMEEGEYLMMAYASPDGSEIGDKCLVYGPDEEQQILLRFVDCFTGNMWARDWRLKDVGDEQFLLVHPLAAVCVKQTGNELTMIPNCDQNYDKSMLWRFRK